METKEKEVIEVNFLGYDCILWFGEYQNNGRKAILLLEKETDEYFADVTVNLPNEELSENEVIIKDYSENEGMLDTLVSAGIVSKPIRYVQTGYVSCPVCSLLVS